MAKKTQYRIKNWRQYNAALVQRGSLTLWIADDVRAGWLAQAVRKRGRPCMFSDTAILCALTLRAVFRLPLRQTEGFLQSIFRMMEVALPVPDYSTLCLRSTTLRIPVPCHHDGPLHLLVDSTGLKIRGKGEWRRSRGKSNDRKWRKFHIGLNAQTQEIVVHELSLPGIQDATAGARLIRTAPGTLSSVTADGAYDKMKIYYACSQRNIPAVIPPQKNAKICKWWTQDPADGKWKRYIPCATSRHAAIRAIRLKGKKRWKMESQYHRRSLVETAMCRLKRIFGPDLRNKRMVHQWTEAAIRCHTLNIMTAQGMPKSERIA